MLKLFYAQLSPFVRKVLVTAHETGQEGLIERIESSPHPIKRDQAIAQYNPLGQAPTAITEQGQVIYDSGVICEYLDTLSTGRKVIPPSGPERWSALSQQALGDGIIDAALLARYEKTVRPAELQWPEWRDTRIVKVNAALDEVERQARTFKDEVTVGTIAIACAIGYLDLRFEELSWRSGRSAAAEWYERFSARPSMVSTRPQA